MKLFSGQIYKQCPYFFSRIQVYWLKKGSNDLYLFIYIYIYSIFVPTNKHQRWMDGCWLSWLDSWAAFQVVGGSASGAMVLMDEATGKRTPKRLGIGWCSPFGVQDVIFALFTWRISGSGLISDSNRFWKKDRHHEHWRSMFHHESSE